MAVAPGRVNLIGEHTDYNQGFVFPAAIDRKVWVGVRIAEGELTELTSQDLGVGEQFDCATVEPRELSGWVKYPAAVAWAIRKKHGVIPPNLVGIVYSDLPIGASLSSSAAIELAFAKIWNELLDLKISNLDLALLCQFAENEFVGMKCGVMDQLACALGVKGNALFIDTRSLEIEPVPLPDDAVIVICDTKTSRELANSAYNERRSQCEEACRILKVESLRDATLSQLNSKKSELGDLIFRRARHVITENIRCQDFFEALKASDYALLGKIMKESHLSLRDDYEVSSPALNAMAESAWKSTGCIGARMTGAGFGGACVSLVHKNEIDSFLSETSDLYKATTGQTCLLTPCETSNGATIISDLAAFNMRSDV